MRNDKKKKEVLKRFDKAVQQLKKVYNAYVQRMLRPNAKGATKPRSA